MDREEGGGAANAVSLRSDEEKGRYYQLLYELVGLWGGESGSSDPLAERRLLLEIREFPVEWMPEKGVRGRWTGSDTSTS